MDSPIKIHILDECPHCHKRDVGAFIQAYRNIDCNVLSFLYCASCKHGICIESRSFNAKLNTPIKEIVSIYPECEPIDAPQFTPQEIASDFKEAKFNLQAKNFKSSAIMSRSVLEAIMDNMKASGGNLKSKIDDLHTKGQITPALAEWGHSLRLLGNEAVHGSGSVNEEDATQALLFAEMLLTYIYMLPETIRQHRQKKSSA